MNFEYAIVNYLIVYILNFSCVKTVVRFKLS